MLAAKSLAGERYPKLVLYPLGKIGKAPARHVMRRRDRTRFDYLDQASTLLVVQDRYKHG